jgi:hypothetical protein
VATTADFHMATRSRLLVRASGSPQILVYPRTQKTLTSGTNVWGPTEVEDTVAGILKLLIWKRSAVTLVR